MGAETKMVHEDLVDNRFGNLIVLERAGRNKRGQSLWLCQCDCGREIYVNTARLRAGNGKGCGCLKRFEALERQKVMVKKVIRDGTSMNICSTVCHNNTGVRGITFAHGKYEAYLTLKGKACFRGRFDTLAEAVAARKAAEEKWFGPIIEKWRDAENENNR